MLSPIGLITKAAPNIDKDFRSCVDELSSGKNSSPITSAKAPNEAKSNLFVRKHLTFSFFSTMIMWLDLPFHDVSKRHGGELPSKYITPFDCHDDILIQICELWNGDFIVHRTSSKATEVMASWPSARSLSTLTAATRPSISIAWLEALDQIIALFLRYSLVQIQWSCEMNDAINAHDCGSSRSHDPFANLFVWSS